MQGKQSCSLISKLTLGCEKDNYERSGTVCIRKAEDETSQKVLGVVVAALLIILLSVLLLYAVKNPHEFRSLIESFMQNEVNNTHANAHTRTHAQQVSLAVSIAMEIWCAYICVRANTCLCAHTNATNSSDGHAFHSDSKVGKS